MSESIANRYEFVMLFDVRDGNPNGDPDNDNLPRTDPETGHGLVTDVCLKRKIRNYVGLIKEGQPSFGIYIKEKAILNVTHDRAYLAVEEQAKESKNKSQKELLARAWMCKNFYDVRTFGAVMSTGAKCGQVRGPIQMTFARSLDPVMAQTFTLTRMAVTKKEHAKEQKENRTMGRKHAIPYGLYRAEGFISAALAKDTGFNENDLELFWEALSNMFEHDRSAARGVMAVRKLWVFKHKSKWGNAPAHKLFERITVSAKNQTPRAFGDYRLKFDSTDFPEGVTMIEKV